MVIARFPYRVNVDPVILGIHEFPKEFPNFRWTGLGELYLYHSSSFFGAGYVSPDIVAIGVRPSCVGIGDGTITNEDFKKIAYVHEIGHLLSFFSSIPRHNTLDEERNAWLLAGYIHPTLMCSKKAISVRNISFNSYMERGVGASVPERK